MLSIPPCTKSHVRLQTQLQIVVALLIPFTAISQKIDSRTYWKHKVMKFSVDILNNGNAYQSKTSEEIYIFFSFRNFSISNLPFALNWKKKSLTKIQNSSKVLEMKFKRNNFIWNHKTHSHLRSICTNLLLLKEIEKMKSEPDLKMKEERRRMKKSSFENSEKKLRAIK